MQDTLQLHTELARHLGMPDLHELQEQKSAPEPTTSHVECTGCAEDIPREATYLQPCAVETHRYCRTCLNQLFHLAATNIFVRWPTCCNQRLNFNSVLSFLTEATLRKIEVRNRRGSELADETPFYYHVKTCSAYIPIEYRETDSGRCPTCGSRTCLRCRASRHPGQECKVDIEMQTALDAATIAGWRRCPGCAQMIERLTGCSHMTCVCGIEFCFRCGAVYVDMPGEPGETKQACRCPLLVTDEENEDDGEAEGYSSGEEDDDDDEGYYSGEEDTAYEDDSPEWEGDENEEYLDFTH